VVIKGGTKAVPEFMSPVHTKNISRNPTERKLFSYYLTSTASSSMQHPYPEACGIHGSPLTEKELPGNPKQ